MQNGWWGRSGWTRHPHVEEVRSCIPTPSCPSAQPNGIVVLFSSSWPLRRFWNLDDVICQPMSTYTPYRNAEVRTPCLGAPISKVLGLACGFARPFPPWSAVWMEWKAGRISLRMPPARFRLIPLHIRPPHRPRFCIPVALGAHLHAASQAFLPVSSSRSVSNLGR